MVSGPTQGARKLRVTVGSEGGEAERVRASVLAQRLELPLQGPPRAPPQRPPRGPLRELNRGGSAGSRRVRDNTGESVGWRLMTTPDGLLLIGPNGARTAPCFTRGRAASHARENDLAAQPLARALGIAALGARLQRTVGVLDATAGFGTDAWLAAALGADVLMVERDPVIHALLEDALARARCHPDERTRTIAARLSLEFADGARDVWPRTVDVVYLDPMYPQRRVRGGQRKQIDALQHIVGHDARNERLLDDALGVATVRTVVKRPKGAEPLHSPAGHRPSDAIDGPNTRYDRYPAHGPGRAGRSPSS